MRAAELPAPRAEGTLASRPFAHLLLYIEQQRLTGTLVIWPEQRGNEPARGQDRVRFDGGHPVAGRLIQPGSTLARSLLPLFGRVQAPYAFYETDLVGTGEGVLEGNVEPIPLITASLRGAARDDAIDTVLKRLGTSKVRLRTGANVKQLGLLDKEEVFLDLVRAEPQSVSELMTASGNERLARRLIYLLTITRCIEPFTPSEGGREATGKFGAVSVAPGRMSSAPTRSASTPAGPRSSVSPRAISSRPGRISSRPGLNSPSASSIEPAPPPPESLSSELQARWAAVGARADAIERENYYQMLDVPPTATDSEVRDSYFALAKQWHPDRLPPELMLLRPWADRIFHHLTRAKDTLGNEKDRTAYRKNVQQGGGTPESDRHVNAIVQAAMDIQKAEVLVRRSDWEGALELVAEAKELNPEDADIFALEALCLFNKQGGNPPHDAITQLCEAALAIRDDLERALYVKAEVLKRQGDEDGALRIYRQIIQKNPRHTEAMREIRIHNMRKKNDGDGGFLSKLFGNKK